MGRIVIHGEVDVAVLCRRNLVRRGLHGEEIHDRRIADERQIRRPPVVTSETLVPGAIGIWSAVVESVMSAVTQSESERNAFFARAAWFSSFAGRNSAGNPYLRRFVRSVSNSARSIPSSGASMKLFRKLPLSAMRPAVAISGALVLVKPACGNVASNVRCRVSPAPSASPA